MARASVTSFDVARCAGVSRSTVSRVFTGDSRVDPDTRRKVLDCAGQLGYRVNGAARALATSRSRTVGIVFYELDYLTEASFGRVLTGAAKSLSYAGYNLHFCCSNPRSPLSARQHFLENAREGMLDAVIVMDYAVEDSDLLSLNELGIPFVLIDRDIEGFQGNSVWNDHFGGAFLLARHLAEQGAERIAFLGQSPGKLGDLRHQGILHGSGHQSLLDIELPMCNIDSFIDEQIPSILSGPGRPDAILCDNAVATVRTLFLAMRLGLRVPEDLAVVSFEDDPILSASHPEVTAARVHWEAAGEIAGRVLMRVLEGGEPDPPGRPLPVSLVIRGSSDRYASTHARLSTPATASLEIREVVAKGDPPA